MATRILLAIALLLSAIDVSAQADKVKLKARVSPATEVADNCVPKNVVSNDGRTFVVLKVRDPQLSEKDFAKTIPKLEQYDLAKLNLMRTMDPSEKLGKQKVVLEELVYYQDSPRLFGTIRNLKAGELSIVSTKVDHNLTRNSSPYEEVLKFNTGITGDHVIMGRSPGRSGPLFLPSTNGKALLIASPEVRDTVAGKASYLMAAVDSGMMVMWQHVIAVEEGTTGTELVDAEYDDGGNAWLLIRYDYKGKKVEKGEIESEIKLFHVGEDGIRGIRFGLGRNQYVTSALFDRSEKGGLMVAGVASTTEEGAKPEFIFTANMPTEAMDISDPRITKDPFAKAPTRGPKSKKEIRDLHFGANGDAFLIFEEYEYASIPHPKTLVHSMKHVHGPVHVLNLGSSGTTNWTSSVRRLVHADNKYIGNVYSAVYGDQLALFMLDSEELAAKRNTPDKDLSPADLKNPYTEHFMFDAKGAYRTKPILQESRATMIAGRDLFPLGNNKYLGFATSKFEGAGYLPIDLEFTQ